MRNPFEQRRADLDRIDSMMVKVHTVTGWLDVTNAGEASVDVNFPVWFIEKPGFYFGGELADGFSPVETDFPTISVMVLRWDIETRGLGEYWVGATLGVVTTGAADQKVTVHWHMEGKALRNPVGDNGETEDTV